MQFMNPMVMNFMRRYGIDYAAYFDQTGRISYTPATAANRRTAMWDLWVSPTGKTAGAQQILWMQFDSVTGGQVDISINADDTLRFYVHDSPPTIELCHLKTTRKLRDYGSFLHIHIEYDAANTTASMWINGELVTDLATNTQPTNTDGILGGAYTIVVGDNTSGSIPFEGYYAAVRYYNGQVNGGPEDFAEFDLKTGYWKPKKPTTVFGTNDHDHEYLFGTSGSEGIDTSGNGNNGTKTGTVTQVTSTPTNRHIALTPLQSYAAGVSLSNGNRDASVPNASGYGNSAVSPSWDLGTGKYYFEVTVTTVSSGCAIAVGNCNNGDLRLDLAASGNYWVGGNAGPDCVSYLSSGNIYDQPENSLVVAGSSYTTNDVIGVALDYSGGPGAGKVFFAKNGTWQNSAIPTSGTGAVKSDMTNFILAVSESAGAGTPTFSCAFEEADWTYAAPTGFLALASNSLPAQTGNIWDHIDLRQREGTGGVTSETGMAAQPFFCWSKPIDTIQSHGFCDAVGGVNSQWYNPGTAAFSTYTDCITSFNSDGVTFGADATQNSFNNYTSTHLLLSILNGTSVSSWSATGTITPNSEIRNLTLGFAAFQYTGDGNTTAQVECELMYELGLSASECAFLIKSESGDHGIFWHPALTDDYNLYFQTTGAQAVGGALDTSLNGVGLIGITNAGSVNTSGVKYRVYVWAPTAFIKLGKYKGNGLADGPFIHADGSVEWIMSKMFSGIESWIILDGVRPGHNPTGNYIYADLNNAEGGAGGEYVDLLSNGVKARTTGASFNSSGADYAYIAFVNPNGPVENPGR